MKRRDFIETSLRLGAALGAGTLTAQSVAGPRTPAMKIVILATNWGDTDSIEDFCRKIKGQGYDGLELWYPTDADARERLVNATREHGLVFGLLAAGKDPGFVSHQEQFESSLRGAIAMRPIYINCHSGRDFFTVEQNRRLVDVTLGLSRSSGVPIHHETHRSRMCYSAPVARHLLEQLPDMTLTLDISHWCNVHESLLQDQQETVEIALQRTRHIHARVGHAQGPQVNDPRAVEWRSTVDQHLAWWDRVVELRRQAGAPSLTFLTEFGPPNYMPTLPNTQAPVASQAEINLHMLKLLRQRYQA
ncbi:MAG: TIM barrel protein [Vicinamibacterales bacterium]